MNRWQTGAAYSALTAVATGPWSRLSGLAGTVQPGAAGVEGGEDRAAVDGNIAAEGSLAEEVRSEQTEGPPSFKS